jgi:hypothetical protein
VRHLLPVLIDREHLAIEMIQRARAKRPDPTREDDRIHDRTMDRTRKEGAVLRTPAVHAVRCRRRLQCGNRLFCGYELAELAKLMQVAEGLNAN